jgi:hypothetical protein
VSRLGGEVRALLRDLTRSGESPPVGPSEDRPSRRWKQAPRRARARLCLLKGCEEWFEPVWPQARYCSEGCREAAARWRVSKAQERYRQTERCRACRREQSRRRRGRLAEQKRRGERGSRRGGGAAWVIAPERIFMLLRPAWLLRDIRENASVTGAEILLTALPACSGACLGAREALAKALGDALASPRPATSSLSGAYCS